MLEPAKNGTPDYSNLEHGKMNATVKAEGNAEASTPNTSNKTEGPITTPSTTRENTEVTNTRPQKPREARRVALRVTRTTYQKHSQNS